MCPIVSIVVKKNYLSRITKNTGEHNTDRI